MNVEVDILIVKTFQKYLKSTSKSNSQPLNAPKMQNLKIGPLAKFYPSNTIKEKESFYLGKTRRRIYTQKKASDLERSTLVG